VERDLHVDERVGRDVGRLGGEAGGRGAVAQDQALDEAHHVERRPVDLGIAAVGDARGHGHRGLLERGHDPPLAVHVVRGRQRVADRRTAQRPLVAGVVGDAEGEVGAPGGDQVVPEGRRGAGDVGGEPRVDLAAVDPPGRVGGGFSHGGQA
jgi:hypothetical protein